MNSDNCFCENSKVGQFRRSFDDKCRVPCGGNKNEFCGGLWRNAIYSKLRKKFFFKEFSYK